MNDNLAKRAHLLVVDDDPRIRTMLTRYFEDEGYRVSVAENGRGLRQHMANLSADLVLLDLNLPDDDGLTLTRELRGHSDIGIVIVTGRADDVDRIVGLEVGADDYIVKPFNLRELLARVKSVLRRLQPANHDRQPQQVANDDVLHFEGWTLDRQQRRLFTPTGEDANLTTGEYDILTVFIDNAGRVLTRDFLLDHTKGRTWEAFDRTIDAQVSRLRRKIEDDIKTPVRIKSVRGVGYLFTARIEKPVV